MRHAFGCLFLLVLLAVAGLFARDYIERHPQDVPWTKLSLEDPIGRFTSGKLAALSDDPGQCRSLLAGAGVVDQPTPPTEAGPDCGYQDGMQLAAGGARQLPFRPAPLVTSCPVAAAALLLEQRVIRPAAARHLDSAVSAIDHAGSYSCRRLYGREVGDFSEHATANALDITGFRLADGSRISVLADWSDGDAKAAFLAEVRDGACQVFSTVLSPDYNQAHRDHLHLDMANRGRTGWTLCR